MLAQCHREASVFGASINFSLVFTSMLNLKNLDAAETQKCLKDLIRYTVPANCCKQNTVGKVSE